MTAEPLVSVGLPVYNGERYLREAIESILAQRYRNLELVISDNASQDGTEAICREYAARDARVLYHRSASNRGAVWNFNRVFELARGEYFLWQAFDDARHPEYLSRCLDALRADPRAVLCCTGIRLMDETGADLAPGEFPVGIRPVGATPELRLDALAGSTYWYDFYGMVRASALARTRMCRPVWGFDVVLLWELCLMGPVVEVAEPLFSYRIFRRKAGTEAAATLGASSGPGPIPLSWTEFSLEMLRAIAASALPARRRHGLAARFLRGFVLGNPLLRGGMDARDVRLAAGRALARRDYRSLSEIALLAACALPPRLGLRAAASARLRLRRAVHRGRAP
ncbi:MAG TPA: glycosyltransferase [Longimicrobium sp.]|jgi:hypothetical protein|uniref:glycosyltransferase family 2 protein n=1 Tax=Longimicrobium sp. TaxID=2029185 RepID=UPI002ED8516F